MNDKPKLKYYLYVSESKVDMLYAQVPKSIKSKLESEVKLNLQLLNVSFTEKQFEDTLYTKLNATVEYLNQTESVGSVHSPQEYFKGSMYLQWAQIHPGIVFWGGKLNDTIVGLGGSMRYILGQQGKIEDIEWVTHSHSAYLADLLMKELEVHLLEPKVDKGLSRDDVEKRIFNAVDGWADEFRKNSKYSRSTHKFEFFAKKLRYSNRILLGTPLYVAFEN